MEPADYAWVAVVVLAASFIRSFSGFGFALVSVPLLALRIPLAAVPPLILLLEVVIGGVLTADKWHRFRDPILYILMAGIIPSVYAGTWLLTTVPEAVLRPALGVGIVAYALRLLSGGVPRQRTQYPRAMAGVAGVAGGLIGGMFGTPGPPIVMYLNAYSGTDKSDFRARILVVMLLENLWRAVVYGTQGLLTGAVLGRGVVLLPLLAVGMWAGSRAHHRISDRGFQRVIAGLLVISGCALLLGRGGH